eukprot:CAMPEP_0177656048 /NCGR_PEP_ID=MMETSP0447-20121125/15324_1 /TAXON_ID=0 /ORGANISM="Stygamoeba regulata, Strain BSH-02190019" /LENGTH=1277 /DNA_ID=CAMNT_0019160071 /DNA_START=120 /DNA_END=3953 /DNA_ORIENTATION=+
MHLYDLTVQKSSAITTCIYGNFTSAKAQEILVARNGLLELLRPDDGGKLRSICQQQVFGVVRSLAPFRLTGGQRDYVVVGSDSGRVTILQIDGGSSSGSSASSSSSSEQSEKQHSSGEAGFHKIHEETFGRSGCRRIVPGQYVAADPKGRAVMVAALEKQKLVYILNRDSAARLTISSPLEAHRSHMIIVDVAGVDVGFENPLFAVLEVDYNPADRADRTQLPADQKEARASVPIPAYVAFYELDLGLNHVVRKWASQVPRTANRLITVPGAPDGPGGVLVCAENLLVYKNQDHPDVVVRLPRREGFDGDGADGKDQRGVLIVSHTTHTQRGMFFFLLQTELGDLLKVTLKNHDGVVSAICVQYFDTVPVANSMAVLRTGFLFVAAEFGPHRLYQFQSLGDDAPQLGSAEGYVYYEPHSLENLLETDSLGSVAPITSALVADILHEETPQILMLSGRGHEGALRILRHGISVSELATTDLPDKPSAIWSVRKTRSDDFDQYIVVSFAASSMVLSIGETVEDVPEQVCGFSLQNPTIDVQQIGDDGLVQIYPTGIRHISSNKGISEWRAPGKRTIKYATSNEAQVIVALTGGDVICFELDDTSQLVEVGKKEFGQELSCIEVGRVPEGRRRARFLAVGAWDNTVRVFSLDPSDILQQVGLQAVAALPQSLCIVDMPGKGGSITLQLNIGLKNGVLLRTVLDQVTGSLSDTRRRFLGALPIQLFRVQVQSRQAMLAISSRTWLCFNYQGSYTMRPLSYERLSYTGPFSSQQCLEGFVGITDDSLRIFTAEHLGETFNHVSVPLGHTPRQFVLCPQTNYAAIIETDHNPFVVDLPAASKAAGAGGAAAAAADSMDLSSDDASAAASASSAAAQPAAAKQKPKKASAESDSESDESEDDEDDEDDDEDSPTEALIQRTKRTGQHSWVSALRLVDIVNERTLQLLPLPANEAAFTLCTLQFESSPHHYLVVGAARQMRLKPRSCAGGVLHVYRVAPTGTALELVHSTEVEDVPGALVPFQGRLLAGVGSTLRIYDLGKRKLLRKCEKAGLPTFVRFLKVHGSRVFVGDAAASFLYCAYRAAENSFHVFADQAVPRWLTAAEFLDHDTMAGADKFGNVFVCRLPADLSAEIDEDLTGIRLRGDGTTSQVRGAPYKVDTIVSYYVGEVVTSLSKASLIPGGSQFLLYTTISGAIGALLPFTSREDVDFFQHLEMHMRQEFPPLCGRDHLAYRSYYVPVKDVIDGNICEQYSMLDAVTQRSIAEDLDRTTSEVSKKLENIRNMIL